MSKRHKKYQLNAGESYQLIQWLREYRVALAKTNPPLTDIAAMATKDLPFPVTAAQIRIRYPIAGVKLKPQRGGARTPKKGKRKSSWSKSDTAALVKRVGALEAEVTHIKCELGMKT